MNKQTVKALGGHNIIVECEVLNRQYCEPRISFVVRATDTGHLELVKISGAIRVFHRSLFAGIKPIIR